MVKKKITSLGVDQATLVDLLDKLTGRIWLPVGVFNNVGGAAVTAVGSTEKTGMAFNKTTDEAVDTMLVVPKPVDITKVITVKVYWSSVNTTASRAVVWNISYGAYASGDDVGGANTVLTTTDVDITTADDLDISDAMTIPADTLASLDEMLSLVLRRDANNAADTVDEDAEAYGILIEYTPLPEVRTI